MHVHKEGANSNMKLINELKAKQAEMQKTKEKQKNEKKEKLENDPTTQKTVPQLGKESTMVKREEMFHRMQILKEAPLVPNKADRPEAKTISSEIQKKEDISKGIQRVKTYFEKEIRNCEQLVLTFDEFNKTQAKGIKQQIQDTKDNVQKMMKDTRYSENLIYNLLTPLKTMNMSEEESNKLGKLRNDVQKSINNESFPMQDYLNKLDAISKRLDAKIEELG